MKIDLQKMSYLELLELKGNIDRAIESKKVAEKSDIKKKVRELIEGAGFDVGDIVGSSSSKSLKGRKVAPKYRNPKNPDGRTYCGDECRSFGRLHPAVSLEQLPVIWRNEQNHLKCSNKFLYGVTPNDEV